MTRYIVEDVKEIFRNAEKKGKKLWVKRVKENVILSDGVFLVLLPSQSIPDKFQHYINVPTKRVHVWSGKKVEVCPSSFDLSSYLNPKKEVLISFYLTNELRHNLYSPKSEMTRILKSIEKLTNIIHIKEIYAQMIFSLFSSQLELFGSNYNKPVYLFQGGKCVGVVMPYVCKYETK